MSQKRSATEVFQEDFLEGATESGSKQAKADVDFVKKHTLDSDEEDSVDDER